MTEIPIHMELDFLDNAIMSICNEKSECAPDARYWFPLQNTKKLEFYKRLGKIACIDSTEHFTKLVAGGIVVDLGKQK